MAAARHAPARRAGQRPRAAVQEPDAAGSGGGGAGRAGARRSASPLDAEDPRLLFDGAAAGRVPPRLGGGRDHRPGRRSRRGGRRFFLGNNGTGVRFLLAQLAALPGSWVLDGTERLRRASDRAAGRRAARTSARGSSRCAGSALALPLAVAGRPLAGRRGDARRLGLQPVRLGAAAARRGAAGGARRCACRRRLRRGRTST